MFISVVLPAPFSPSTPCTVPGAIVNETSLTARTLPKLLVMCCSSMLGMRSPLVRAAFDDGKTHDRQMIRPKLLKTLFHRKARRPLECRPRHPQPQRLVVQQLIDCRHPGGWIIAR